MASIGPFIRATVLPTGLSVSAAARRLGIGRPALSNLLNGNAKLSRDMALKLEREFGADANELIRHQAELDAEKRDAEAREGEVRANAAGYLKITSTDIAHWSDKVAARTSLSVLLRRLVHADGPADARIDFPGYDDGERPGWDGLVESARAGHWVPEGRSGWELSTSKDLPGKPNRDFRERMKLPKSERRNTTFTFVTTQGWPDRKAWADAQRALGEWRDVRAYDASDIEQWLEQSATTQVWFREQFGPPADGIRTIGECWEAWTGSTTPPLSPLLFEDALQQHRQILHNWLNEPGERPFVIVADSAAEALAFVALALKEEGRANGWFYDATVLVDTQQALRRIAAAAREAVLVVADPETEVAASSLSRGQRVIIVRPRTSVENDPDVALDTLGDESFSKALEDMGLDDDRREQLKDESGLSATILRRRLANAPALRTPDWSREPHLLRKLIPMLLAGAWNRTVEADKMLLSDLASGNSFEEVEIQLTQLLAIADSPVWAIGNYRGIVSRKDALFAAGTALTQEDIERFFIVADLVLSEDDPALDLPVEDRWTAGMHGKKRDVSGALRAAVGELLVLFAVYGDRVLARHLQSIRHTVEALVEKLLRGVKARHWLAQRDDLPLLAEAAPCAFLNAVEADLRSSDPQIVAMLRPAGSGPFDSPDRSGLLWALETVAWDEEHYLRVARILARLSAVPIDDNWVNKPENSLGSLVRSWFPQTSASIEKRLELIDILVKDYPAIGWKICSAQIDPGAGFATNNSKPRWRPVDTSASRPPDNEIYRTNRYALDKMLTWRAPTGDQLGDLIEVSAELPSADQEKIWARVARWIDDGAGDVERAALRERMRRSVFSRRSQKRTKTTKLDRTRRTIFDRLAPTDMIQRYRWLFAEHWVSESGDELFDDDFDYDKHQRRVEALRRTSIQAIYGERGLDGIGALLAESNAWSTVGRYLADATDGRDRGSIIATLLRLIAQSEDRSWTGCLEGFLLALDDVREPLVRSLIPTLPDSEALILLKANPFEAVTWSLLDTLRPHLAERYWREVAPYGWRHPDAELNMIVDRLLAADRPFSALNAVHLDFKRLEGGTLARLLRALTKPTTEEVSNQISAHSISEALAVLHGTGAATIAEMAQLEYLFIDALSHSKHGIPNLEKQIGASPGDFVHLVSLLYRRDDGAEDPSEMRPPEGADLRAIGHNVFRVLERLRRTPGTQEDGAIDTGALLAWLTEARERFRSVGRSDIGDSQIGQLLGRTVTGSDGIWPHQAVREALEACGSDRMMRGMEIGLHNSRGAVWRGKGGAEERTLAERYRGFAQQLRANYPITARLLEYIAETYASQAEWHDTDEAVRKRLQRR
ncbi:MAG TPA: helix-turn-helix domain-containing protein [Allosphingosinicella sp.]|jgi:plasmid maintenance system antidote protein VapI